MFKYSYISSSFKPTALTDSTLCNFLETGQPTLCVACSEWLQVYRVSQRSISLVLEIPASSQISNLCSLRHSGKDALLILTQNRSLYVLTYNEGPKVLSETQIALHKPSAVIPFKLALSTCQQISIINAEKNYFTIVFLSECKITDSFIVPEKGEHLIDMQFLKNSFFVAFLYEVKINEFRLKICEVVCNEKKLVEKRVIEIDTKPYRIAGLEDGRCLVFCERNIMNYNMNMNKLTKNELEIREVSALCEGGRKNLVVSDNRFLYLVQYENEISLQNLGKICSSACLAFLGENRFFLGSRTNNSKFFQVLDEVSDGSYIEDLQVIPNIGPIIDFKVNEEMNLRVLNMKACCGCDDTGGFKIISKGVTVSVELEQDISNIQGIWTVRINSNFDTHIFLGFLTVTKIFEISGNNLNFCDLNLESFNQASVLIFYKDFHLVQIVAGGIFIYSRSFELISSYDQSYFGSKIVFSSTDESVLAICLSNQTVVILDLALPKLTEYSRSNTRSDISSLYVSSNYLALGLWEKNSVVISDLRTGAEVFRENSFAAPVRSMRIIKLPCKVNMVVGLRNGFLVFYEIRENEFIKESVFKIGYQGIVLDVMSNSDSQYVFAACDRPVILYHDNRQFRLTHTNIKDVSCFSSFHIESMPNSLALSVKNKFLIVSVPQLQEYSFENFIKGYTVRRLVLYQDKTIALVFSQDSKTSVRLYDCDMNEVDSFELGINESPNSITVISGLVYVGLTASNPSGKLLVFSVEINKLELRYSKEFNEALYSFAVQEPYFFLGFDREIRCFKILENSLEDLNICQKVKIPVALDIQNSVLVAAEMVKTVIMYSFKDDGLELTHRNYRISYPTAVKILTTDRIIAADSQGTIYVLQANSTHLLDVVSMFNIGLEVINLFKLNLYPSKHEKVSNVIFATTKGRIGIIFNLDEDKYKILKKVEEIIISDNQSRNFSEGVEKRESSEVDRFVKGDVVEMFMEYSPEKRRCIALGVSKSIEKAVDVSDVLEILLDLIKTP